MLTTQELDGSSSLIISQLVTNFVPFWNRQGLQNIDYGWSDIDPKDLKDACQIIGMVYGSHQVSGSFYDARPIVMNAAPSLQHHVNLFNKSTRLECPLQI